MKTGEKQTRTETGENRQERKQEKKQTRTKTGEKQTRT